MKKVIKKAKQKKLVELKGYFVHGRNELRDIVEGMFSETFNAFGSGTTPEAAIKDVAVNVECNDIERSDIDSVMDLVCVEITLKVITPITVDTGVRVFPKRE